MKRLKSILSFTLALILVLQFANFPTNAAGNEIKSKIATVSKYGNIELEIKPATLYEAGFETGDMLNVTIGKSTLEMPFVTSYSDVDTGSLLLRDDKKNDLAIIAINMGNFSTTYNAKKGDELNITLKEKKAYYEEYLIRQLERTNTRSDYEMDSIFANFRAITSPKIKAGLIYRSSSPINNEISRARYANDLAEAVGIKTVINLADNEDEIKEYMAGKDFKSPYYKSLLNDKKVVLLDMDVDLKGKDFGKKLVEGLTFMANNDAPYLIHCTEGKDRVGFASAVIGALTGASINDIVTDYMLSFENYYNVKRDSEQYNAIAKSNIIASMTTIICGLEKGSSLEGINLAAATEKYLIANGMTQEKINLLKKKLSSKPVFAKPSVQGKVVEIEKYGHTSTDIKITNFMKNGFKFADMLTVVYDNGFVVNAPFLDNYYVEKGMPLVRAYDGHENVAVCINYGKIGKIAKADIGTGLTIFMDSPQEYITTYEIRKLKRTNDRNDYASDAIFANFRPISFGKIGDGILYRSASPINNELGRAKYGDALIKKAGVKTVINMADSDEDLAKHIAAKDFDSPYYKSLIDNKNVTALNMAIDFESSEFASNIAKGAKFIASNKGPYLIHCTEGKDRAGFMSALLEALMGASKEEIIKDYMTSYDNYYGVKADSKKYDVIANDVIEMLKHISSTDDLTIENMQAGTHKYLLNAGMKEEEIAVLKGNLLALKASETEADKEEVKPDQAASSTVKYIVVEGDTLREIATQKLSDSKRYTEIFELNKDKLNNPDLIIVGQELLIPAK